MTKCRIKRYAIRLRVISICLLVAGLFFVIAKIPEAVWLCLASTGVLFGVGLILDWFESAKDDLKKGRIFELVFGALIYLGVLYFIYYFLKTIFTGN
jgi:uncharacterized membrane protein YedE/YeeE